MAQKHTAIEFAREDERALIEMGVKSMVRAKSDGKSVRSFAVTQRRPNPTWSKAE